MPRLDPHSFADLTQGRISEVEIDWDVNFTERKLQGSVLLSFAEPVEGPLDLDTRDLTIHSVQSAEGQDLNYSFPEKDDIRGECLRLELAQPTHAVKIAYETSPNATALQWLEGAHTAGGEHPFLFSQCQPHHARSMMPVQDTARARFRYSATVRVDRDLTPVMSAAPGQKTVSDDGQATYSFEMPQPIPSYLLALAVGNLDSRDLGARTRVYAEPETLDAAAWEFEAAESMLEKAEELFGPYRWGRYDFLMMPPAFPYGGMENPRLTFLTPSLLAGDRSLVNVLAHELAHSWTGNLVTNATMNDFWLNEGFTVWAERRILETLEGKEQVALAAAIGRDSLNSALKRFGEGSPYTRLRTELVGVDPDEVYSEVPYEKGFLFVSLLEQTMGSEDFDQFLTEYMDRFAFQSITTEEFVDFLKERAPVVNEKIDLKSWLYDSGIPEDAPTFESGRLFELRLLAENLSEGELPTVSELSAFSADEWIVFMGGIDGALSTESCVFLDEKFRLSQSKNAEILAKWLTIAAVSGYAPALEKTDEFLSGIGRMKFLKPLYQALNNNDQTRDKAIEIYKKNQNSYHPIAQGALKNLLGL